MVHIVASTIYMIKETGKDVRTLCLNVSGPDNNLLVSETVEEIKELLGLVVNGDASDKPNLNITPSTYDTVTDGGDPSKVQDKKGGIKCMEKN